MKCKHCQRACEFIRPGKQVCSNCLYIAANRTASVMHQMLVDIGNCQVCRKRACELVWDNLLMCRYNFAIEFDNPIEFIIDRTAVCVRCSRGAKDRSLAKFGTMLNVLSDHPNWAEAIASSLAPKEDLPLPEKPTRFVPGSPEKVEVLRRRAEQGYSIFHPQDNPRRTSPDKLNNRNPTKVNPNGLHQTLRNRNSGKKSKKRKLEAALWA